mgnify:FL=1
MSRDVRQKILREFIRGNIQYLVNVGIATEGFDVPGISVVAMARPTQSRALYAQCIGRGTRPLTGILDGINESELRRGAIKGSDKPRLTVIDFVGNSGRHSLMSASDVLGGKDVDWIDHGFPQKPKDDGYYPEDEEEEDVYDPDYEEKNRKIQERARLQRGGITAQVEYETHSSNPFEILSVKPRRFTDWYKRRLSERQLTVIRRAGIDPNKHNPAEQCALFDSLINRRKEGLCTFKQAKLLGKFGIDASEMTFRGASLEIDRLSSNGWKQ